jgi:L-amino acid N-acyltransferase YncA
VTIRPASTLDAERCAAIYRPYVETSWISFETIAPGPDEMAHRIASYGSSHGWLVFEVDQIVAGFAYGSPHRSREAYQTSCDVTVYVDPAYERRGIGRLLYEALLAHLADRGFHAAFAGIALPNDASIALHETMGFSPLGIYREVGWKMGGWRDVGWWQRLL